MSTNLPPNLHMIVTPDHAETAQELANLKANIKGSGFHFTNGTYMLPSEKIVPTMLAGFDFLADWSFEEGALFHHTKPITLEVSDHVARAIQELLNSPPDPVEIEMQNTIRRRLQDAFVIAVNSNISMQGIMDAKNASDAERAALESQEVRALKVALPLAERFPDRDIAVIFYDEDTPTALYTALSQSGIPMTSLFKWGYGTDPNAPRIEGADLFQTVLAFPMPNDDKPVCHDLTVREDQTGRVQMVKLTEAYDEVGRPYFPPRDLKAPPPQPPAQPAPTMG